MEKNTISKRERQIPLRKELSQKIKLLFLFLFIPIYSFSTSNASLQTISLNLKDVTLKEALVQIEKQSGYNFMYSENIINVKRGITINVRNKGIDEVLQILFAKTDISYTKKERIIVLSKSEKQPINQVLNAPSRTITGKVVDTEGEPLIGVSVSLAGTTIGTITDVNGDYSLSDIPDNTTLVFSFIGMTTQRINVKEERIVNVTMQEDAISLDEVVAIGYGVQKKATLTGSVVALQNEKLVATRNENVANMLTGKMPGLRISQLSSEPGTFNTQLDIRGMGNPLIIIDGIPRDNMMKLDGYDIESVSVLKDASAAIYGVKAANGVVLITTKKGSEKEKGTDITYNGTMTWQMPSGLPKSVSAVDYMLMANEHDMNKNDGLGTWRYSQEMIDTFLSGERQSTDWYNAVIRDYAPQTQHHLGVSGNYEKIKYFTSIGYQSQESFFKSDNGFNYNKYNLRAGMNGQLSKYFSFDLKLSGIIDKRARTQYDSHNIVRATWRQLPLDPIYANDTEPYYYQTSISESNNPVAWINSDYVGYRHNHTKTLQTSGSVTYKAPFLKGLSATALFSYDYNIHLTKNYSKSYLQYRYNETTEKYQEFTHKSPSTIRQDFSDRTSTLYQLSLNYVNSFYNAHNVNILFLTEGQKVTGNGFYASRQLNIDVDELMAGNADNQIGSMTPSTRYDYVNESFIGRTNYDYKGKYLAEFAFRVDGSSRFPSKERWGFFPSASIGYRISEEGFWKNSFLNFVDNFKIRGSYGVMGDDQDINYQFISGYVYPSNASFFGGNYVNGVASTGIPNEDITWYTSKTMNIGFDAIMWNGLLGITFEAFKRKREGLPSDRQKSVPSTIGATFPQENLNSDMNYGYEIEISHRNRINDFRYSFNGHIALTRLKNVDVERADDRSWYHNWRNNPQNRFKDIRWAYSKGGQYGSFQEIAEFPVYVGRDQLPGNYYHEDWNGDGVIDALDTHPIGLNTKPLLNFGFTIDMSYKGFDLNMLWQGSAMSTVFYNEILNRPLQAGYDNTLEKFLDRWRPTDPHADPFDEKTVFIKGKYPMPGGASYPGNNSEFSVYNNRYLRLKNIELGYTLPKPLVNRIGVNNLRVFVGGYNLLTFSPVDFVDPEHPEANSGYMYPLNKTITVGLTCKF